MGYFKTTDKELIDKMNFDYAALVNDGFTTAWREAILIEDYYYLMVDEVSQPYFQDCEIVDEIPPEHEWHFGLDIQVILTYEDNLKLLSEVPELAVYVRNNDIPTIIENGYMYIYANFLLEEHREILEQFNAIINERSI